MDNALVTQLAMQVVRTFDRDRARKAFGDDEEIGKLFAAIEAEHGRTVLVSVLARWKEIIDARLRAAVDDQTKH